MKYFFILLFSMVSLPVLADPVMEYKVTYPTNEFKWFQVPAGNKPQRVSLSSKATCSVQNKGKLKSGLFGYLFECKSRAGDLRIQTLVLCSESSSYEQTVFVGLDMVDMHCGSNPFAAILPH